MKKLEPMKIDMPTAADYREAAREISALLKKRGVRQDLSLNASLVLACLENVVEATDDDVSLSGTHHDDPEDAPEEPAEEDLADHRAKAMADRTTRQILTSVLQEVEQLRAEQSVLRAGHVSRAKQDRDRYGEIKELMDELSETDASRRLATIEGVLFPGGDTHKISHLAELRGEVDRLKPF